MEQILLSHGSGGILTHELIKNLFAKHFANEYLDSLSDSALIEGVNKKIAFTTDSYVISPIIFPGGDIGKLAICGTVNDLAVTGALPMYLSCGFIIEEGLDFSTLEKIVISMAETAKKAGVKIVTGDTKVVEKGSADKLFINTAGIGYMQESLDINYSRIESGDNIIINGNIGDHGLAVMSAREGLNFESEIKSDCAPLNLLINELLKNQELARNIKFMRDPTRGGLATTLCEIAESTTHDIEINENSLPISENVKGISEILGIDPLFSANEGKVIIIAASQVADQIVDCLKKHTYGKNSKIIGEVKKDKSSKVYMKTEIGTSRNISMLTGAQLPRIC